MPTFALKLVTLGVRLFAYYQIPGARESHPRIVQNAQASLSARKLKPLALAPHDAFLTTSPHSLDPQCCCRCIAPRNGSKPRLA